MDVSEATLREAWRRVATAAATGADGELGDAIRHALGIGVGTPELIDALLSGAPALDWTEARTRIETEQARRELLGATYARIAGDWACGG